MSYVDINAKKGGLIRDIEGVKSWIELFKETEIEPLKEQIAAKQQAQGQIAATLAGMTDFCVLDEVDGEAIAWVGDYPYLDKELFLRTINDNGVSDSLIEFEDDADDIQDRYGSDREEKSEEETEEEYITVR